jgi:hypothetical protein
MRMMPVFFCATWTISLVTCSLGGEAGRPRPSAQPGPVVESAASQRPAPLKCSAEDLDRKEGYVARQYRRQPVVELAPDASRGEVEVIRSSWLLTKKWLHAGRWKKPTTPGTGVSKRWYRPFTSNGSAGLRWRGSRQADVAESATFRLSPSGLFRATSCLRTNCVLRPRCGSFSHSTSGRPHETCWANS